MDFRDDGQPLTMKRTITDTEDRTARQRPAGTGMDMRRLWLCGHKGSQSGALMRHGLTLLCPDCNQKRKQQ